MHTLTKIKLFRIILWITYPFALIFLYPLALLRKKNEGNLFFFFDRYIMGGAQTAHLNILYCIPDLHKQVYFTRTSANRRHRDDFYKLPQTEVYEVQQWCEHILFRIFSVHYFVFYINRHKNAHVFSSNCTFFYDMLPFLAKHVVTTELLHSFSNQKNGMEFFGLGNYKYLTHRIVIDKSSYLSVQKQYNQYHISDSYFQRVQYIENSVDVPATITKSCAPPLRLLYAGRGGEEKRIDRIDRIARQCIEQKLPVEFQFAGDDSLTQKLSDFVKTNSVMHGNISNMQQMYDLYRKCHVVLITSVFEGFPMVVKEGMACGCIPMVTALEGMTNHLKHGENALLLFSLNDDDKLIKEGMDNITRLINDNVFLGQLSSNCHQYAIAHFNKAAFIKTYQTFFRQ